MKTAHFMDFKFDTDGLAFFPRPETEILVEKAVELLARAAETGRASRILDIGTGSGNIAISLTKYIPSSRIVALDVSESAIRVASKKRALPFRSSFQVAFRDFIRFKDAVFGPGLHSHVSHGKSLGH